MITDIWKPYYFWKSGSTYTWEQTLHPNNFYGKANKDVYFTNEKCLSGITYTYITSLDDIYQKNGMTNEDEYALYNQYNQFDVIDRVTKNYSKSDIAVDYNVDITKSYHKLDDALVRPNQQIILFGQTDKTENDIYNVTNNYKLKNSGRLSTTTTSDKQYSYVNLGTYKDKFIYLYYTGSTSPTSGDAKEFIEGASYVLKNLAFYNLNTTQNRIIFTDYNLPRKMVDYTVLNDIEFDIDAGVSFVSYSQTYKHDIHETLSYSSHVSTDYIWLINGVLSGVSWDSKDTMIYTSSPSLFSADDYIKITFPVNDTLIYKGHIKQVDGNWLHLYDSIPPHIFNNVSGDEYMIDNLSRSTSIWNDMSTTLDRFGNDAPASYFYDVTHEDFDVDQPRQITISPNQFEYNKHFNHTELELEFKVSGSLTGFTGTFPTTNQFINYKIYETLQEIAPATYTSAYSVYNTNTLTAGQMDPGGTYYYHDMLYIKPLSTTHLSNFKEYTYVDVITGLPTEKALIVKITDVQIILEKPVNFLLTEPSVLAITNVDGLQNISDILYEVYLNNDYDWYRQKGDFTCRQICKVYGEIIDASTLKNELTGTTSGITGIIYESNEFDNYVFKIYDHENDSALTYEPSDILVLGQDLKTKFPVPVKIKA